MKAWVAARRFSAPILFVVLAAVFGVGSALIVPDGALPALLGRVGVSVVSDSDSPIGHISFLFDDPSSSHPDLTLTVETAPPTVVPPVVKVDVLLPNGVYSDGCTFDMSHEIDDDPRYPERCVTDVNKPGLPTLVTLIPHPLGSSSKDGWDQTVTLHLNHPGTTVATHAYQVNVLMPRVTGMTPQGSVDMQVDLPQVGGLVWQGRFPDYVQSVSGAASYVAWDLTTAEVTGRPVSAEAVNPAGQSRDSRHLFLAGAFVGIAGAAVIAAIQEVFAKRSSKEKQHAEPAAA